MYPKRSSVLGPSSHQVGQLNFRSVWLYAEGAIIWHSDFSGIVILAATIYAWQPVCNAARSVHAFRPAFCHIWLLSAPP